jgi:hypothetical protein
MLFHTWPHPWRDSNTYAYFHGSFGGTTASEVHVQTSLDGPDPSLSSYFSSFFSCQPHVAAQDKDRNTVVVSD